MTTTITETLPVAEVFGPTWQGEGRHAGQRCGFLRLGLCNLACEWCDTAYTWDRTRYDLDAECPPVPVPAVLAQISAMDVPLMVLTGGEPLIHARPWPTCPLGRVLLAADTEWHLETNGTLPPPDWLRQIVAHATVSPKLNTADPARRRVRPEALRAWALAAHQHWADFKFVARTPADLDAVDGLVESYRVPPDRVWVMPEGTDPAALLERHRVLAPHVAARGFHTTTRLQTLLWGDERAR